MSFAIVTARRGGVEVVDEEFSCEVVAVRSWKAGILEEVRAGRKGALARRVIALDAIFEGNGVETECTI